MEKYRLGKNQFWIDDLLSKKFPVWKQAFMGILLRYYRKYIKYGLVHPPSVIEETQTYRIERAVFTVFIFQCLEETGNPEDSIHVKNLRESFKIWHYANKLGKPANTSELITQLDHIMGTYDAETDSFKCYTAKMPCCDDDRDSEESVSSEGEIDSAE